MPKKIVAVIKLALKAGKATPAPPVGPALGQHGVNIALFCKDYNARTADKGDLVIPKGSVFTGKGRADYGVRKIFINLDTLIIGDKEIDIKAHFVKEDGTQGFRSEYIDLSKENFWSDFLLGFVGDITGNITSTGLSIFQDLQVDGDLNFEALTINNLTINVDAVVERNLQVDGTATLTVANITGGNIDATPIGVTQPSTGRFTSVNIVNTDLTVEIGNIDVQQGNINAQIITGEAEIRSPVGGFVGDVFGNLDGTTSGTHEGDVKTFDGSTILIDAGAQRFFGSVTGNVTGDLFGNVTGDLTGLVTGNLFGDVYFPGGAAPVLQTGSNVTEARLYGNVTGDVIGNVTGDLNGNLLGDVIAADSTVSYDRSSGNFRGDITSTGTSYFNNISVAGDLAFTAFELDEITVNNTLTVLGSADINQATVNRLNVTTKLTADLTGDVFGDVEGNVYGNIIGEDSSVLVNFTNRSFIGNVMGDVYSTDNAGNYVRVLDSGTSGLDAQYTGSVLANDGAMLLDAVNKDLVVSEITGAIGTGVKNTGGFTTLTTTGLATLNSGQVTDDFTVGGTIYGNVDAQTSGTSTLNNLIVQGDLTVQGAQTILDVTTVEIQDKTIQVASNAADRSEADLAGLEVNLGTDGLATFYYNNSRQAFESNIPIESTAGFIGDLLNGNKTKILDVGSDAVSAEYTGNVTGDVTGNLTGNVNAPGISSFFSIDVSEEIAGDVRGNIVGSDSTVLVNYTTQNAFFKNVTATGTITGNVDGDINSSTIGVSGTSTLDGQVIINNDVDLGLNDTNTITLNGLIDSNILVDADNTRDLGATATRLRRIYTHDLEVTDDVNIGGNLVVTGDTTIAGNLTFGDANNDNVSFVADIDSNFVPNIDNTYTLGNTFRSWQKLYLSQDLEFTGASGANEILVPGNAVDALSIKDASSNDLIVFDTTCF